MKDYYVLSGQIQNYLSSSYKETGIKRDFIDALAYLHYGGKSAETRPEIETEQANQRQCFDKLLTKLPVPVYPTLNIKRGSSIDEINILPEKRDVFVIRHFNYIDNKMHHHDYFELNYVLKGKCLQKFEEEQRTLNQGEVCIIAPGSLHDIMVDDDDSVVICIMIRKSTFNTAFFDLLSGDNLLAGFFKTMLYGESLSNYLLFFNNNMEESNDIVARLLLESYRMDEYANRCCIYYAQLLCANILRKYHSSSQYNYYKRNANYNVDIPIILQHIQKHYRTISLGELAAHFHYSENHLSRLIRKNTKLSFSEIVTNLKISAAMDYLHNSDYTIGAIAEIAGYESSDHFSRVFKKIYKISPNQYRKQLRG